MALPGTTATSHPTASRMPLVQVTYRPCKSSTQAMAVMGPSFLSTDLFVWLLNVVSSVGIIAVNKVVMDPSLGWGFTYATTLSAMHFLASFLITVHFEKAAAVEKPFAESAAPEVPFSQLMTFVALACTSIASLNISLMLNSVGVYQIAKLLNTPFVCAVEYFVLGQSFSNKQLMGMAVVIVGAGLVTAQELTVKNYAGLFVAALAVVATSLQQIGCGILQRRYNVGSATLLSMSSRYQAPCLLVAGPFVDKLVTSRWVWNYFTSMGAFAWIVTSSLFAVLVNWSQYMCLGRFSATSFQVLGHSKTVRRGGAGDEHSILFL